jgi:exodeoxyribonuclease VII small subunit
VTTKKDEAPDASGDAMTDSGENDAVDVAGDARGNAGGDDAPSLEDRLKRLEEIVRSLEAADLDMEGALELFEEGVEHVRGAEATLRIAELKVEELLGPEDDPMIRPLEEDPE